MKKGPIFAPSKKKLIKFATKWKVNPSNLQTNNKDLSKTIKNKNSYEKDDVYGFRSRYGNDDE